MRGPAVGSVTDPDRCILHGPRKLAGEAQALPSLHRTTLIDKDQHEVSPGLNQCRVQLYSVTDERFTVARTPVAVEYGVCLRVRWYDY